MKGSFMKLCKEIREEKKKKKRKKEFFTVSCKRMKDQED